MNSSNSSSESDEEFDSEVEEFGDLPECSEKKDGKVYYVGDEDITYTCRYDEDEEAGKWVGKKKKPADDDDLESSSSAKKTKVSSSSIASGNDLPEKVGALEDVLGLDCNADLKCQKVFVEEVQDYFFCNGVEMRAYSPILDAGVCPADTDDDDITNVTECDVIRSGDQVLVRLVADGIAENITMTIDAEGVITETDVLDATTPKADFMDICKDAQNDKDILSVYCDESSKTITGTYKDEDIRNVDELEANNKLMCQMIVDSGGFGKDLEDALDRASEEDYIGAD